MSMSTSNTLWTSPSWRLKPAATIQTAGVKYDGQENAVDGKVDLNPMLVVVW